jgi:hypothetical protein
LWTAIVILVETGEGWLGGGTVKLYQVSHAVEEIQRGLADGVLDEQAAADTLDSLFPVAKEKGLSIAALVQNKEIEVRELKAAEERIAARRKRLAGSIASLKNYLLENMERLSITEISCPEFVVKLQANPPKVAIAEGMTAHEFGVAYTRSKMELILDKKAIRAAIESGEDVEGASLVQTNRVVFK